MEEISSNFDSINIQLDKELKPNKITIEDFLLLKLIGKGSYGKVYLVKKKEDEKIYAMKILKKKEMMLRHQVLHIKTEKRILETIKHPFIINLECAFHNKQKLYLITEFIPGGELFFHLSRVERFNEASAKFYAAQMVLGLEYLHSKNIIYRE
jgi:serine/threonine protein kinase